MSIQVGDDPEPDLNDPAIGIPYRADRLVAELDDWMVMARETPTADLVANQRFAFEQVMVRAQLILSFIDTRNEPKLRIVRGVA